MRIRHIDFPAPGLRELAIALARRPFSALEVYLMVASFAILAIYGAFVAAIAIPLSALCFDAIVSRRTWGTVASWRAARQRRRALNSIDSRERRRVALADRLAEMVDKADYAWRAYIADAVVGRTHSVITDRPSPQVQPLRDLQLLGEEADRHAIELADDDHAPDDRLAVPPAASFAPDVLSPTMMNLTAAAIAHAQAEGPARARRRYEQAVAHATEFAPPLAVADRAVAALRADAPERRRGWLPWRRPS